MEKADADVKYEFKTVQAIRGLEGKTRTKWQNEGWELVSENTGTLRTELTFRRVKPKAFGDHVAAGFAAFRRLNPKVQVVSAAVVALVLLGSVIGIAVAASGGSEAESAAASTTPSTLPKPSDPSSEKPTETSIPEPGAEVIDISVDDLLDKLNAGNSKAGDLFRVTGELFLSDLWLTGATGDYSVMLKAQGGKQDLSVFVDESEAAKWTDGTRVELVLKNVEKTIDGETSDGWLEVQSAKIVSGARPRRGERWLALGTAPHTPDYAESIDWLRGLPEHLGAADSCMPRS